MLSLFATVLTNFVIVFISIVLFMAPFYAVFRWRQHKLNRKIPEFNHSLELFFNSPQANWLVFFWAVGEATVWFVIPEFLLILLIFMRVNKKFNLVIYDIYGTIFGTILAMSLHLSNATIANLPYIQPHMLTKVGEWYGSLGVFGLVYQPYSGVPYKVFTNMAPDYHFFIPLFLLVAIVVRISRYYFVYALLNALYPGLHRFVSRHYIPLFTVSVFLFSIMLLKISLAYR